MTRYLVFVLIEHHNSGWTDMIVVDAKSEKEAEATVDREVGQRDDVDTHVIMEIVEAG